MPNIFVIFPEDKLAEAQAYKAFCDGYIQDMQSEPEGILGLLDTDVYGQHVTTYLGPPYVWEEVVPEPPEAIPLRADGVLHDNWVKPIIDDF
ncbi:hypothetical protein [Devosia alba]|uniref:hypothetical protein n=1 Tax=Devosia alba TaxID=3152360 RepID=UPI00326505F3